MTGLGRSPAGARAAFAGGWPIGACCFLPPPPLLRRRSDGGQHQASVCSWKVHARNRRQIHLPRAGAVASVEDLHARTSADIRPSHLVKSLLTWVPRPDRQCEQALPVPVVFHRDYGYDDWDVKHRFVMGKFHGVMRRLETLQRDKPDTFQGRFDVFSDFGPIDRDLVERVHHPDYVEAFCSGTLDKKALRKIGLPWSESLVKRTLVECEGTRQTALLALRHGLACNTGGGTHHAFSSHGSGFTIFNDLAVTARWVIDEGLVSKVLILDLDVHQGDGTAAIFANDGDVHTVSFHCASNFPFEKQESDLDVALADALGDKEYLLALSQRLPHLLNEVKPDLVLYDAGVDVHRDDVLGKLCLTDQGMFDRDYYVIRVCSGLAIPVATVVGGKTYSRHSVIFHHSSSSCASRDRPAPVRRCSLRAPHGLAGACKRERKRHGLAGACKRLARRPLADTRADAWWAGGYDKDHALLAWRHSIVFQAAAAAGGVRAPEEGVSSVCGADEVDEGEGPLGGNAAAVEDR